MTTPDKILAKTNTLLRRHGHLKLGVIDVARALGMSHANIYRHFSSKSALLDEVTRRWLAGQLSTLDEHASGKADPARRLRQWILALHRLTRDKASAEPEHFAMYRAFSDPLRDVVHQHFETLIGQLARLAADLGVPRPKATARAIFDATFRYHHPAFAAEVQSDSELEALISLLLAGLKQQADKSVPARTARLL